MPMITSPQFISLFAPIVLLVSTHLRAAEGGTVTVVLPCYQVSAIDAATIANDTQFIVSKCDGVGRPANTFVSSDVLIEFRAVSPRHAILTNLSVLMSDSVSVSLCIYDATATATIIGLSIVMRNVSNPAYPAVVGIDCETSSNSWCQAMVALRNISLLHGARVSLSNVVSLRNESGLVAISLNGSVVDGYVHIDNATYSGTMACVFVGSYGQRPLFLSSFIEITNVIVLVAGTLAASAVYGLIISVSDCIVEKTALVSGGNVVTGDARRGSGGLSGSASAGAIVLFNVYFFNQSSVTVFNTVVDIAAVDVRARIVYAHGGLYQDAAVRIAGVQLISRRNVATLLNFYGTVVGNVEAIVEASLVSSSTIKSFFAGVVIVSDVTADGLHVRIANTSFTSAMSGSLLWISGGSIRNASISIATSNSTTTSTDPAAVPVMVLEEAVVSSVNITVTNGTFMGGHIGLVVINSLLLDATALAISGSSILRSDVAMVLSNVSLTNRTRIIWDSSRVAPTARAIEVEHITMVDADVELTGTVIIDNVASSQLLAMFFVTMARSRITTMFAVSSSIPSRLLFVNDMEMTDGSSLIVDMGSSAAWSRPATFDLYLLYVYGSSVINSSVMMVFPAIVRGKRACLPPPRQFRLSIPCCHKAPCCFCKDPTKKTVHNLFGPQVSRLSPSTTSPSRHKHAL